MGRARAEDTGRRDSKQASVVFLLLLEIIN